MKKILVAFFCFSISVPVYSDALDSLKIDINKEKNEKLEQKRKAQEQERKEKAHQEHLADCKQAQKKAKDRKQEIEQELGKEVVFKGISGKIVSVTSEGVFVENDCYEKYKQAEAVSMVNDYWGNWAYMGAATCRENRRFIYTNKDNLFVDHKFSSEYLFVPMDGYKYTTLGGTTSVPSYKETAYKVSEIEYETYLKDKSNKTCPQ